MKPCKLVEVIWEDAHTVDAGGWAELSDLDKHQSRGVLCVTVGYLRARNKNGISLAASLNFDQKGEIEQISGTFIIPAGMVKKVRILK